MAHGSRLAAPLRWLLAWVMLAAPAFADDPPPPADPPDPAATAPHGPPSSPYDITVREKRPTQAASSASIRRKDIELRILDDPGDFLRAVPGLFTGQHAGGGKADQILLRGFDSDHGTDVAIHVDGLPVNIRSHAHGQGYADLHFLIPESVDRIEVFKGPYYAEWGDFATAGAINLVPRRYAPESQARIELGGYGYRRYLALGSPRFGPFNQGPQGPVTSFFAGEAYFTDGPFHDEQNMSRYSFFGRTDVKLTDTQTLTLWGSSYNADWSASGQIPQRAVDDGTIRRFGSVDDSEGGDSGRDNYLLRHTWQPTQETQWKTTFWASRYDLDLYSNFTFFLDPNNDQDTTLNGDGIRQQDNRWLWGTESVLRQVFELGVPMALSVGVQQRTDNAHVRLSNQRKRTTTTPIVDSDITETSIAGFAQNEVFLSDWARAVVGIRMEYFRYLVKDQSGLPNQPRGFTSDGILLPKANLILDPFKENGILPVDFQPLARSEFYFNYGHGFHSNDARDVLCNTGDPSCVKGADTLPRAIGWEIGWRTTLWDRVDVAIDYWWLNLESELVFVGDAGETEIRPRSRRRGVEAEVRAQIFSWLRYDADVTWSHAEFTNGDQVPQAPQLTAVTGLTANTDFGLSADVRLRALGQRCAEENCNEKLHGYAVGDFSARYRWRFLEGTLAIENFTNAEWRSAEFYFPSALNPAERGPDGEGVNDFHFTPGNPRTYRVGVAAWF